MFDGMAEQFYQFLAATTVTTTTSSRTTAATADSLPLPLSFSLHHHNASSFPTYSPPPPSQEPTFDAPPYHHHLLHPSQFLPRNNIQVKQETLNLQHDALLLPEIPWSNDEMLALFRIRSTMDTSWFPDFIWENVSRKLAELGFKRSAEKCKEKFEEEFNNSIISSSNNCSNKNNASNNNYTLFGELEELCINNNTNTNHNINHGDHQQISHPLPPDHDQHHHHPHPHPQTSLPLKDDNEDEGENEDEDDGAEHVEENENDAGDNDEEEEVNTRNDEDDDNNKNNSINVVDEQTVDDDSEKTEETTKKVMRKRKRQKKFEMFKGFCKKIVNKMMVQQEQLHTKILQDMVKRDEEKVAREEAWKQQEIERVRKELEVRAHEQAIVGDRQAKILDCLKKFTSSSSNTLETHSFRETLENLSKVSNVMTLSNFSILTHQDSISSHIPPTSSCTTHDHAHNSPLATHQTYPNKPTSLLNENVPLLSQIRLENSKISLPMSPSSKDQASQNPNPPKSSRSNPTSTNATDQSGPKAVVGKDDTGRRWPRDEVLALINIRCSLFINNNNINNGVDSHNDRESFSKGPLWERISQKMMELGYKRSAKRCKEKWENINKYFRKTKDLNKKRSLDSRTCPYFHQLSHLYSQGTLTGPTDPPINLPASPENSRTMAFSGGDQGGGSTPANCVTNTMHASQGIEGVVQVPGFDFEF